MEFRSCSALDLKEQALLQSVRSSLTSSTAISPANISATIASSSSILRFDSKIASILRIEEIRVKSLRELV